MRIDGMKPKFTIYFLVFILIINITSSVINNNSITAEENTNSNVKKWTFMLYDDADFYHAYDPLYDFAKEAKPGDNINLLIIQDAEHGPAYLWLIDENKNKQLLEELGEINMGDYSTLKYFLEYCKNNYPAERYIIDLYNHGNGWLGACVDDTNNSDMLSMSEIKKAITETGGLDIITFNAPCLMGSLESVYELRNCVEIYVGSEAGSGFDPDVIGPICNVLNNEYQLSNIEVGEKINDIYKESSTDSEWLDMKTRSTIRTDKIEELVISVNNLSKILANNLTIQKTIKKIYSKVESFGNGDVVDVYDFAEKLSKEHISNEALNNVLLEVMTNLNNTVISEFHGENYSGAHGLTIYFPNWDYFTIDYKNSDLDFVNQTEWDEFIKDYLFQITVDDDGLADYSSIQSAINNSNDQDGIFVYNGTYNENIVVDKSVTIVGEKQDSTIIDGGSGKTVVTILSDYVNLSNFKIKVSFNKCPTGIIIRSSNNTIIKNYILNSTNYGNSGIILDNASGNTIYWNAIKGTITGITLDDSHSNNLIYNSIFSNTYGLMLYSSEKNEIVSNYIGGNYYGLNISDNSFDNRIYTNNFVNNYNGHVYDTGINTWYNTTSKEGNYWDDYEEKYPAAKKSYIDYYKGVWDTPYQIPGGNNKDLYPLFHNDGEYPTSDFSSLFGIIKTGGIILAIICIVIGMIFYFYNKKKKT